MDGRRCGEGGEPQAWRSWPHRGRQAGAGRLLFLQYNANKRSVTVNLKDPRGVELVKEMAKKADIFCENFAPARSSASASVLT